METHTDFKSSNVAGLAYDARSGTLEVEFKSGDRYAYNGITPKRWHDLKHTKSVGSFIHSKIVPKHDGRKLGAKKESR